MTKALIVIGFIFTLLAMSAGLVYAAVYRNVEVGLMSAVVGLFVGGVLIGAAHDVEFGGDAEDES